MILQTGGFAMGETSTRSRPNSTALARATSRGRTPNCSPSGPMTRSSRARIRRFVRASRMADSLVYVEKTIPAGPRGFKGLRRLEPVVMCEIPAKNLSMVAAACDVSRPAHVRASGRPRRRRRSSKWHGGLGRQLAEERVERLEAQIGFLAFAVLARRHALPLHLL